MENKPISSGKRHRRISPAMACLSWLNIGVQFALPISAAFTPAIAARVNQPTFLPAGGEVATLATRPYTLAPGETVETVAARYNMTPDALRKLNQFRSFARGWAQLRPGDELDVPTAPLPKVVWEGGAKVASAPTSGDTQTQRAAGLASRVGGFLGSNPNGEAASSLARGMATGAAGGEIQQWLNQFGTARVQLDADKQFSLKNSRLELLVPLHEQKDKLVFTQGSVHRTDERTQANLGLGYRWFADGWMLGGNTFLDHDISRSHTRMGVGVEYWRDFLKLGANSYMRLSGWKDSPDVTDYEERPANGWDVRAQAWVPAMPQLGGKLTYEQYYGNEVGLFGKDNRQRDPHAITAGVNYTPVPLLTFNAEHRQGQSGKNDARLGVEMRYQLGVPWRQQLDPGAISALRSLAGSRHDLVERNNNIVLEYRKKEVIRLHMAETVSGRAGEKKSLGVSVTSKYGLSRIEWHAPALLAAGGKIVHDGAAGYSVVLPAYQTVAGGVNTYTVGGVAIDMRDNVSNHSETQVTVLAPVISESLSSFMPASSTLLADGQSTQVLTLTLKDAQGGVVDVAESEVAIGVGDGRALKSARLSALKKTGPGIYAVTVTAGKDGEVVALTPVVSGVTLPAARVTINDMAPAAAQSTLVATPDAIVADNRALTTLTLTLKNAAGDALSGLASQLALAIAMPDGASRTADALTLSPVKEGSQKGVYTATFKGAVAGKYTLVPEYNGSAIGNLSATVTLRASAAVKATSAITVTGETFVSGSDIPVTVTLKDAQGNAVSGQTDSLKDVAVPNAVLKGTWAETAANSGVYRATYTAKTAGTGLQATLTLNGASATPVTYAITAGQAVAVRSTIVLDKASYVSGEAMTVTVTLKDAQGNPVSGQESELDNAVAVPGGRIQTETHWSEEVVGTGKYRATYVARVAGNNQTATLKLSGEVRPSNKYAITAGPAVPDTSTIDVDGERYISGGDMKITVTLKDAADNAVSGQTDSLKDVAVPNAVLKGAWTETAANSGVYSGTYTAQQAGTGLKATLKRTGWSREVASKAYVIASLTFEAVIVNGHQFPVSVGFPSTGFSGATFTLKLKDASASDFNWAANANWVNVNDGVVSFTGQGTGSSVTITATPKTGGNAITYSFNLKKWFATKGDQTMTWERANMTCSLPRIDELTNSMARIINSGWTPHTESREVGSLWSEWGNLTDYSGPGFEVNFPYYWTSEPHPENSGNHYLVFLNNGRVSNGNDLVRYYTVCRQEL